MRIGVLGPLELDEGTAGLGSRDRIVLAALAMTPGELLSPEQLADAVWGDQLPATWTKNVQGCISRLRKRLGPGAIETSSHGYRLRVPSDAIDVVEFARAAHRARELVTLKEFEHARYVAARALELWRGRPLADLEQWEAGAAEASRLCEVRAELEELVVEASLAAGHQREVLTQAASMVEAAPLRERRWALLARAQYQAGDQHEALRTLRRVRVVLLQELGLDPGPDLVALEQAILRQEPDLLVAPAAVADASVSPYPGLTPYGEADAESYFGRETDIATCLDRLTEVSLLAVVGPSGSGKSSLLRAGLAPALRRDGADVRMLSPGQHPMDALEAARGRPRSVILVDQAEEAFSLCTDESERDHFFTTLVAHTLRGRVVLALRADHTGELAAHQGLAVLVERGLFLLPAMSPHALRSAIEGPARLQGLVLEPGLTDLLVREVEGEPGALPLLSHALRETWVRHEGRTLTVAGYQASGGIRGAVAQSAEQLYGRMGDNERALLRELVLRLVVPGPEGEAVRGRMPRHQVVVAREQDRLVDLMIAARLVTSDDGVIELAHEAVVRAWPRLRDWLEDDLEGQRMRHRLTLATEDWAALGFQDSELYRGARLSAVGEWIDSAHPQLTDDEQRFLTASFDLAEAEEQSTAELARTRGRMVRRLRVALGGVAVLLVLALITGFFALGQVRRANRSATAADADRVGAQALTTTDITQSLLMAVAGARLDPSPETEQNLDAALAEHPQLVDSVTVPARSPLSLLSVSPDGRTVAVADKSHHVWTYDAHTLNPIIDTQVGRSQPSWYDTPLAFSPAGDSLAVGGPPGRRGLVRLLHPHTLLPLRHQLRGWPGRWAEVVGLAYSADGRSLAVDLDFPPGQEGSKGRNSQLLSDSGAAFVWDLTKPGRRPTRVRLHHDSYDPIALGPDGRQLYFADSRSAYDLRSSRWLHRYPSGFSPAVTINSSGQLLAGTFGSGGSTAVTLVDAGTTDVVRRLTGSTGNIEQIAFSPDGNALAATTDSGQALVWDTNAGDLVGTIEDGAQSADGLGWSPDGRTLFTTAAGSDEIHAWDLSDFREFVPQVPVQHQPSGGAFWVSQHADEVAVAYNSVPASLSIIDVKRGIASRPKDTRHAFLGSAGNFSPDGRRFAAGYSDGWVQVFSDGRAGAVEQRQVWPRRTIETVCYTPNGQGLVAMDDVGDVRLVNATTLEPQGPAIRLPATRTWSLVTAPDNREAFVYGAPPIYRQGPDYPLTDRWWLVDLVSGQVIRQGKLDIRAENAAFSPQGHLVALGGHSGEVELLNVTTGRPVGPVVAGNKGESTAVAFNADGSRFVTASSAGDMSLWDGRTGEPLGTTTVPEQGNPVAGFRPDGTLTVVTGSGDVFRWDPSLAHAIGFACHAAGRDLTADEWRTDVGDRPRVPVCPQ